MKTPHELEEHLASAVRAYLRAVGQADGREQKDEQRAIGSALEYLLGSKLAEDCRWDRGKWVDGILPHSFLTLSGVVGVELRGLAISDGSNWEGRRAQWIEPFAATARLAAGDEAKLGAYTLSFGSAAHGLAGIPYGLLSECAGMALARRMVVHMQGARARWRVNEHETRLEGLPGPILDLDVDPLGNWVALCGARHDPMHLVISGSSVPLGRVGRFPLIRALDAEHVLLVDTRCGPRERNAYVVRTDGRTVHEFRVGDAVADVVIAGDHMVVTYFDEAFGAPDGLAGVVVFDRGGEPQLRDRDSFGGSVVDCYCAGDAGRGRVFFLAYPGFLGLLLDVRAGTRSAWATPRAVHGASAVTVAGDTAFFSGSYDERDALSRWRFGSSDAERLGSHTVGLRGLPSGRMLAVNASGYSVLSFDEFAS